MHFLTIKKRSVQDSLILYGLGFTFIAILPFAVYRFINNDFYLGILDSIFLAGILGTFVSVWYSLKIKYLNALVACFYMFAAIFLVYLKTAEMIFWAYPAIIATYFLFSSSFAGIVNCLFIGTIISISVLKDPSYIGFYPSLLLVGIFGFIFSLRSEKQHQKLELMIMEDPLTQLKNRRSFDERLAEILALNKRFFGPVCLFLLDLDDFKKLNEVHGSKQGDEVLFDFAQHVRKILRVTDYIYRFNDDKFAIITTNVDLEHSAVVANNIRESILKKSSLAKYNVSVSIGISQIHQHDDINSCFSRTNLALHKAKKNGKNKVYLALQNQHGDITFSLANKKTSQVSKSTINHLDDGKGENEKPKYDFETEEVLI